MKRWDFQFVFCLQIQPLAGDTMNSNLFLMHLASFRAFLKFIYFLKSFLLILFKLLHQILSSSHVSGLLMQWTRIAYEKVRLSVRVLLTNSTTCWQHYEFKFILNAPSFASCIFKIYCLLSRQHVCVFVNKTNTNF